MHDKNMHYSCLQLTTTSPAHSRTYVKHSNVGGALNILGFGSTAQAILPMITRHTDIPPITDYDYFP